MRLEASPKRYIGGIRYGLGLKYIARNGALHDGNLLQPTLP